MHRTLLIVTLCGSLAAALAADEPAYVGGGVQGVLLLSNGELLAGRIARSGDFYVVTTPEAELQVRVRETSALCRDIEDAYRRRAAQSALHSADGQLDLAQWCIDRKLFGYAARSLTEAYRIDDTNPRIVLLERRLKAEMTPPKPTPEPVLPAPIVGVREDVLDATVRSISAETFHEFTTKVQPLLVNYCATAGCHGPKAQSNFQLHRVYLNERADPRLVRQNLHAVLAQIDRRQIASSRLITTPLTPHGGGKRPIFHAHNVEHYRTIAAWATRTTLQPAATPATASLPTSLDPPAGALLQRLSLTPPVQPGAEPISAAVEPESATPASSSAVDQPELIDPFDPEVFNRRRKSDD